MEGAGDGDGDGDGKTVGGGDGEIVASYSFCTSSTTDGLSVAAKKTPTKNQYTKVKTPNVIPT